MSYVVTEASLYPSSRRIVGYVSLGGDCGLQIRRQAGIDIIIMLCAAVEGIDSKR